MVVHEYQNVRKVRKECAKIHQIFFYSLDYLDLGLFVIVLFFWCLGTLMCWI